MHLSNQSHLCMYCSRSTDRTREGAPKSVYGIREEVQRAHLSCCEAVQHGAHRGRHSQDDRKTAAQGVQAPQEAVG